MTRVQVFDPPMCCSSGACGPAVDPVLPQFAADLDWLKSQGVQIERYGLSQQPDAFAETDDVQRALASEGTRCLPLVLVNGQVVSRGAYPSRQELALLAGLTVRAESIYTDAVAELVAIGAAIAANCQSCFKYHHEKARKLGVSKEDMARAVATAEKVKQMPAKAVLAFAEKHLGMVTAGQGSLPLVLVDGQIVSRGAYPGREESASFAGLTVRAESIYTDAVAELVAIGAAIAANCQSCFKYHHEKARKLGVSKEDMARAVATAEKVKQMPAKAVLAFAEKHLGMVTAGQESRDAVARGCCDSTSSSSPISLRKCC